jgi:hypothetical protein
MWALSGLKLQSHLLTALTSKCKSNQLSSPRVRFSIFTCLRNLLLLLPFIGLGLDIGVKVQIECERVAVALEVKTL